MTVDVHSKATALGPQFASLQSLPRFPIATLPTTLEPLHRLSDLLQIDLWMKRDDLTGFALGGNKARKLEFLIGDALSAGSDIVISTGGSQSNHARITAAACRKAELDCYLVLDRGRHPHNGNLLLDRMLGAEIEFVDDANPEVAADRMRRVSDRLQAEGRKPYIIPRGGSIPQGAVGYAAMINELMKQCEAADKQFNLLYVATGSCGTHSGIMAGRELAGWDVGVRGISVSRDRQAQQEKVHALSNELLNWLGVSVRVSEADVDVDDRFVGEGYGVPTDATWSAIQTVLDTESIFLDPVYTGKAMAGLLNHVDSGTIEAGASVIFVHTGGAPALFAYENEIPAQVGEKMTYQRTRAET